jgi:hypothetical protein
MRQFQRLMKPAKSGKPRFCLDVGFTVMPVVCG